MRGGAWGVFVGLENTCWRRAGGELRCWGEVMSGKNARRSLGYGKDSTIGDNEYPEVAGDAPLE
jgi:hypothetical protein